MIPLYYLFFALVLFTVGPFLLTRKKARAGLSQKLGFISKELKESVASVGSNPRVWFHAVSVGEFNALLPLLNQFRKSYPQYKIFISTTTATGQELAKTKTAGFAEVFYFPFDLPWITAAYLDLISPSLVGIVETEIWPGFVKQCQSLNIPCIIVNGRLSPKSAAGYLRWRVLFGPVFRNFAALTVQSESEKNRFEAVAGQALSARTTVCGNIKLDGLQAISEEEKVTLRKSLNIEESDFVIVAGSTHEGEESAFLRISSELRCKLIIAPRHPERFERVAQIIQSEDRQARRYSATGRFESNKDVYLLDTIGQLNAFYSLASVAFVGGTLANIGGHNLAEPCIYKVPVLCGPHIHKAKDLFQKLNERNAIKQGFDVEELSKIVASLKFSPEERSCTGENGYRFIQDSQGAVARTMAVLEQYLPMGDRATEKAVSNPVNMIGMSERAISSEITRDQMSGAGVGGR